MWREMLHVGSSKLKKVESNTQKRQVNTNRYPREISKNNFKNGKFKTKKEKNEDFEIDHS